MSAQTLMPSFSQRLARQRVTLGFLFAVVVLYFADPSWVSLAAGAGIAAIGEALRFWAAGHLEKSREVTTSGPYRFTRHPLYVGSSIMGVGVAVGCRSLLVAALVGLYLGSTLAAAIRTEEAFLRSRFGDAYDAYAESRTPRVAREFSLERAWRNREYRAMGGLVLFLGLLVGRMLIGRP
jgi:protein-S-isoprenylcysteine O-methyltransferase Ste14